MLTSVALHSYADSLESGMEAELENGRLARLLIKLGFINERPE
jgi:PAB-dependent poly(A)-specific ribonuclease subunit 3